MNHYAILALKHFEHVLHTKSNPTDFKEKTPHLFKPFPTENQQVLNHDWSMGTAWSKSRHH